MNKAKLQNCDIDSLVAEYVRMAMEYGRAVREGDSRTTNSAHKRVTDIFKELSRRRKESVLLALLDHKDIAVRCWAAAATLNLSKDAEQVLSKIAEDESHPMGGMAEATLDIWRSGEWTP